MAFDQFLPQTSESSSNVTSHLDDEIDWVIGYVGETLANLDGAKVETVVPSSPQSMARLATLEVFDSEIQAVREVPQQTTINLSEPLISNFQKAYSAIANSLPSAEQIQSALRDPELPNQTNEQIVKVASYLYQNSSSLVEHLQTKAPAVTTLVRENAPAMEQYVRENAPTVAAIVKENTPALEQYMRTNAPVVAEFVKAHAPVVEQYVRENAPAVAAIVKENRPALEQYVRANAPAVAEFVRANAPVVEQYVRDNSPAVAAIVKENRPALEQYVRANAPAVAEFVRANAPVVEQYVRENAPAVPAIIKENRPALEQYVRANAPAVAEFARANAPVVEQYVRDNAPAVAMHVQENAPLVRAIVAQPNATIKDFPDSAVSAQKVKTSSPITSIAKENNQAQIALAVRGMLAPLSIHGSNEKVVQLFATSVKEPINHPISTSIKETAIAKETISTPLSLKILDLAKSPLPIPAALRISDTAQSVQKSEVANRLIQIQTPLVALKSEQKSLVNVSESREPAAAARAPRVEIARFPFAQSKIEAAAPKAESSVIAAKVLHFDTTPILTRTQHIEVQAISLNPKCSELEGISIKQTRTTSDLLAVKQPSESTSMKKEILPANLTIVTSGQSAVSAQNFKPETVITKPPQAESVSTRSISPHAETLKGIEIAKNFETPKGVEILMPEASRNVRHNQESIRPVASLKTIEVDGQRIAVLRTIIGRGVTPGATPSQGSSQESAAGWKVRVAEGEELRDKENLLPEIGRRSPLKMRRSDKRYLTGIEIALAGACLIAAVAKSQQPAKAEETTASPAQLPVTLHRAKHLVSVRDSLTNLAEEKYGDKGYAWLLFDLNRGAVKQEQRENQLIVILKERQEIELPTSKDLEEFRLKLPQFRDMRMITVVESSSFSRQLLSLHLGTVIGAQ